MRHATPSSLSLSVSHLPLIDTTNPQGTRHARGCVVVGFAFAADPKSRTLAVNYTHTGTVQTCMCASVGVLVCGNCDVTATKSCSEGSGTSITDAQRQQLVLVQKSIVLNRF